MTRHKQIELLLYISEGHNTFAEISKKFPDISSAELDYYSTCPASNDRLLIPPAGYSPYSDEPFSPEAAFGITDAGKDLLDEYKHEEILLNTAQDSALYAKLAFGVAVITVLLSIYALCH